MTWTLYKEIKYAADGIPGENLTDFPKLVSIVADADIASELSGGGGIKFTSADGLTDIPFGLYPSIDLTAGTVLARVKVTLLTAANVGDTICRLYYSSTESTTEDKAGTVSGGSYLHMPLEDDPSGSAPQMRDWATDTLLGTSQGSMASGDSVAGTVGNALDFDGTDDGILGDLANIAGGFCVSGVFRAREANGTIVSHHTPATNNGWRVNASNFGISGGLLFAYGGVAVYGIPNGGNPMFLDVDNYFAMVVDGGTATGYWTTTPGGTLYSGSVSVGSMSGTPSQFGIAQAASGGLSCFDSIIDEIRITEVRSENWLTYEKVDYFDNASTFTLGTEQGGDSSHSVAADAGSYALTGSAASLEKGWKAPVDTGSYGVTGSTANLLKGYTLTAEAGSYVVTGQSAVLTKQWEVSAQAGSYTLTGSAASLEKGWGISAEAGSYTLAGSAATLTPSGDDPTLTAEAGSYSLSGQTAGLTKQWLVSANAGSYSLSGGAATLRRNVPLSAEAGTYNLSGSAAELQRTWKLAAIAGSYTLTGSDAGLSASSEVIEPPAAVYRPRAIASSTEYRPRAVPQSDYRPRNPREEVQ